MRGSPLHNRVLLVLAVGVCVIAPSGGCVRTTRSEDPGLGGARFRPPAAASAGPRDEQRRQALAVLRPRAGSTTVDAVRRLMGTPDYATDDGSFVAYLVEQFHAPAGVEVYDGSKPEGPTYNKVLRELLVMQFGADGVLRRQKSFKVRADAVPSERFEWVVQRWGQEQAGAAPAAPDAQDAAHLVVP